MITNISPQEMKHYLQCQMENFFPDRKTGSYFQGSDIDCAINEAYERMENCFKVLTNSAYSNESGQSFFNYLHGDQYATFLYFFSNNLWKLSGNKLICDKALQLNRVLNSLFLSYKCEMPDIFYLAHPLGSIIGNADYADYLVISHGVTINTGDKVNGKSSPKIGRDVYLAAGAKIIGNEEIGDRVTIGVDATVFKRRIENDKLVIRDENGKIVVKENKNFLQQQFFRKEIR